MMLLVYAACMVLRARMVWGLRSWSSLGIGPSLEERLVAKGMEVPTQVQGLAIPKIVEGESVIMHAETGSGKTLAYLVPLAHCQKPTIVLAPSQLLCEQIRRTIALVFGDESPSLEKVVKGEACCIAMTPKEALRVLPKGIEIQHDICIVLDEADALLRPLGKYATAAAKEYRRIPAGERAAEAIAEIFPQAQVIAASATVGRPLRRRIGRLFDQKLLLLRKESPEEARAVSSPQAISAHLLISTNEAVGSLAKVLTTLRPRRCLIALQEHRDADNLVFFLSRRLTTLENNYDAKETPQVTNLERTDALTTDSGGPCLVVAPMRLLRGLDFPRLDLVILLGRPSTADDYLHISGRAGRAGHPGLALTLASYEDLMVFQSTWASQLGISFEVTTVDTLLAPPSPPPETSTIHPKK